MPDSSRVQPGVAAAPTGTGVRLKGPVAPEHQAILSPAALDFVATLQRRFNPTREALLARRADAQAAIAAGGSLDFATETRGVRDADWHVAEAPADLRNRRVEITGPTERKMLINALNSGASSFMADFEDANAPTWANMVTGQLNLLEAIQGTIRLATEDGKDYRLNERVATLLVRPRGWHLVEKNLLVDGAPISGSLFDFGLYMLHNAKRLVDRGTGPYFYLPKLESHLEARLWNEVFDFAEDSLSLPRGTVRATVLIETLPAAFQMDEILYELREHSAGLNAGRWDYIFSTIKTFRDRPDFVLPDRQKVTMTVPFMRAYAELLVRTCHRRGAHAIGGMAAFIPNRKDPEVTAAALTAVRADKQREARAGFDGTWVAHPDLVAVAMKEFDDVLGDRPNQLDRLREDVAATADQLLDVASAGHEITDAGLRNNVSVGLRYLTSWLGGNGAAAIFNMMEDAATAEISRAQVWQWLRHSARMVDGTPVTRAQVDRVEAEEAQRFLAELAPDSVAAKQLPRARELFREVARADEFVEFMTIPAYELLD
jgi:malate synthase